jgi:cellulose biosynthesis protein BcsQ
MALIAAYTALANKRNKCLILHNQLEHNTIERYLGVNTDNEENIEKGLDPILRLTKTGQLEAEAICDYADSVLDDNNLDVLVGTNQSKESIYKDIDLILKDTVDVANLYYDYVFIDAHAGYDNHLTNTLIKSADIIFVSINQNSYILDMMDKIKDFIPSEKAIYLCGMYDIDSKTSIAQIQRTHKIKQDSIEGIPIYTSIKDAANKSNILEFIHSNLGVNKDDECFDLIVRLKKILDLINLRDVVR